MPDRDDENLVRCTACGRIYVARWLDDEWYVHGISGECVECGGTEYRELTDD